MSALQLLLCLLTVAVCVVSRLSSLPRLSGLAAVLMSIEQIDKKLFAPAEILSPRLRERISKVDHAAVGSQIENTECLIPGASRPRHERLRDKPFCEGWLPANSVHSGYFK